MKHLITLAAVGAALAVSAPASATVILETGASNQIHGLTAVHLDGTSPATTVFGAAGTTGVSFSSSSTLTEGAGNGVSKVSSFSDLVLSLTNPSEGFEAANFDLHDSNINGNNGVPAFVNIVADVFNGTSIVPENLTSNFQLKNGDNDFSVIGNAGEVLSDLRITIYTSATDTTPRSIDDIRQVDLGNFASVSAAPEPATWASLLLGLFAVGGMMRRRRAATASALA